MRRNKRGIRRTILGLTLIAISMLSPSPDLSARNATYTSPQQIEDAFLSGLRALNAGDAKTAIQIFRSILSERPALPRVRLELARAYFHAREWERSRREFFAVLSGGVPDNVKAKIIGFLREIDARRGFDWDLSVSFAASPTALRDYDTDTVLVNVLGVALPFEIERDDSGKYGIEATGSAEYRIEVPSLSDKERRVTGFVRAFFDVFEGNGSGADDYNIGAGLGARGAWPQTTVTGSVAGTMREFGGSHLDDRLQLRGVVEWRDRSGISLFSSGSFGLVDNHRSNDRDGTTFTLRAGLAKSLGGRGSAGFAGFGEFLDAKARFESYDTLGGEVFGFADLGAGIDVASRIFLLNQRFDAPVPFLFETRDEWEVGFDVELTKTNFFALGQFSPFIRAGFSRRASSIDAFSYNEFRINVGFKKSF